MPFLSPLPLDSTHKALLKLTPSVAAVAEAAVAVVVVVAVHETQVPRTATDGDGKVDQDGGNGTMRRRQMDCRPLHVPSETGGNVTRRLEMFAVGDAPVAVAETATAVGNGAPVGGAPTRVESGGRCCRSFAAGPDKPMTMLGCCHHWCHWSRQSC